MKPLRITVLLLSFAALSFAATCVTSVEQKGDSTWVGEVVNTSDQTVNDVSAIAIVKDATGSTGFTGLGTNLGHSCPSVLLPLEHGAFEMSMSLDPKADRKPKLPLQAKFDDVAFDRSGDGGVRNAGLLVRIVDTDTNGKTARIEIVNNGTRPYANLSLCAVLRDGDGKIVSVAYVPGPLLPSSDSKQLGPGHSLPVTVEFSSFAEGTLQFFVTGADVGPQPPCCMPGPGGSWAPINARSFTLMAPTGWQFQPLQGIDSYVGEITGDGITLTFDHGYYSGFPAQRDDPNYVFVDETIGGFAATLMRPAGGAMGTTAVYFDDLGSAPPFQMMPVKHSMGAENLTLAQQDVVFAIFRTLRFTP